MIVGVKGSDEGFFDVFLDEFIDSFVKWGVGVGIIVDLMEFWGLLWSVMVYGLGGRFM